MAHETREHRRTRRTRKCLRQHQSRQRSKIGNDKQPPPVRQPDSRTDCRPTPEFRSRAAAPAWARPCNSLCGSGANICATTNPSESAAPAKMERTLRRDQATEPNRSDRLPLSKLNRSRSQGVGQRVVRSTRFEKRDRAALVTVSCRDQHRTHGRIRGWLLAEALISALLSSMPVWRGFTL